VAVPAGPLQHVHQLYSTIDTANTAPACLPCTPPAAHIALPCRRPVLPQAGAVAGLRRIRLAALTARLVMEHTSHTLLAGDLATQFALEMGLRESNLSSAHSMDAWRRW